MLDAEIVAQWLNAYIGAWKSYQPEQIAALFSDDAFYYYTPFDAPLVGRQAIVDSWLANQDPLGSYDAHYQPVMVQGDTAVVNGRSRYFFADGSLETEFDNIFILRFDAQNQVREFREWYFERPAEEALS
jgi:hypothetical protein